MKTLSLLLFFAGTLLFSPLGSATPPFLGVNYNESLELADSPDLSRTHATWARGFVVYHHYKNREDMKNDERIQGFIKLKEMGMKTVLSIKFNYQHRAFPQTEQRIEEELALLPELLDTLLPYTDIIVAGNEPFIETEKGLRQSPLVAFYRMVATKIHQLQQENGFSQPVYLGAFNRLWEPQMQQDSSPLLALARSIPWIQGVDLHIHHSTDQQFRTMIDFALAALRPEQTFISTEFSLMHHWRESNSALLPAVFAAKYGYPKDMQVWQYLNKVLNENPVSRAEWIDFLSNADWFESRKHYIQDAMTVFRSYPQFAGATYGLYQTYGHKPYGVKNDPWILNSLFSNRTVNQTDGKPEFHYQFMADFIRQQDASK